MKVLAATLAVTMAGCLAAGAQTEGQNSILIDRKSKRMSLVDETGKTLISCRIGIGKGPLSAKTSMNDFITPTGKFVVDVVLTDDAKLNQIDRGRQVELSIDPRFAPLVKDGKGLADVFKTMNRQDFNRDGKPDQAYGFAFLGLDGKVTGPKLIAAGKSARWYSIALHGTPNEAKAIGRATSEGCIHVQKAVLQKILTEHLVEPGTPVYINDGAKDDVDVKRKSSADDNGELVRVWN